MNSEAIYTTLLSREFSVANRQFPLHGFSYQIFRNESGKVWLLEFGHPVTIVLWEQNGPELADLTEEQVKNKVEEQLS